MDIQNKIENIHLFATKIHRDFSYVPIILLDPEDKAVNRQGAFILVGKRDNRQGILEVVYLAWQGIR